MTIDMTKIANVILYMMHKQVKNLTDKKVSILLFLIDFNHQKFCNSKIFNETYVKENRQPQPKIIAELFDIIANEEDLAEDDERLFLIQELLDSLDIEVVKKKEFIELNFLKMEEEFDESIFSKDELKTIYKIVSENLENSPRNAANACFKLQEVRDTKIGEVII